MAAVNHQPEFDAYWSEFDDIKSTKRTNGEELELPKTPDGMSCHYYVSASGIFQLQDIVECLIWVGWLIRGL